jgi:SAM-dependent methyltransferase
MAWYDNFFDEWYLKYWVKPITATRTSNEVDAIVDYLKLTKSPTCKVLDLCCGQGRHSLELARRGYHVVGYDLSDTLLSESRRIAQLENLTTCTFVQGDMRELTYENEFTGAFNFYTAFGYFEHDDENQVVLDVVSKALKQDGRFLLDYPCLEGRMGPWQKQEFFEYEDGTVMCHDMTHNVFDQTIENKVLYITKDNKRHRTGFTLRHYYGRELRSCFSKAAMNVLATYGDLKGKLLDDRDTRVLVLGQKQ